MKMKLRFFSLLLVGLMAASTLAATLDQWVQDGATLSGDWHTATMWKKSVVPAPTTNGTGDEIKLNGSTAQLVQSVATLTQDFGSATNNNRLTVAGGGSDANLCKIVVQSGTSYFADARIGHKGSTDKGSWGAVEQTGGTVNIGTLQVGYYGTRTQTTLAKGTYKISGGTLQSFGSYSGRLQVGCGLTTGGTSANTEGVFTVEGKLGTVSMAELYVGGYSTFVGKGTLEFKTVNATGVSRITVSNGITLDLGGDNSITNLVVSNSGGYLGDIILVENTGGGAVSGLFDSLNGGSAAQDAQVTIAGASYTLTYVYNAATGAHTGGNDIALIPEPATIALLSLGLIAIRRNKK